MSMYNPIYYMAPNYRDQCNARMREITHNLSKTRDPKARKLMEELKQERIDKNMPSPRPPVLVSSRMEHLPEPFKYASGKKKEE